MAVNYDDERFQTVNQEKEQALNNVNNTYNNMINDSNQFYEEQINASKDWAEQQQEIQQAQTDLAIEQVEQQKEQAEKDYIKEQKGSYADWQQASNQYGANAEAMATQGMSNTGYSESSQVSMYNTYQNRVATARETYNKAVLEYDNAIKEAQLQNSSVLAEIAAQALQQQLELALQGFQYKNTLLQQQLAMQNETEDRYYSRWQDVLSQINTENALAEQIRQYNESLAEEKRQYNESLALQKEQLAQEQSNWEKEYALAQEQAKSSSIQKDESNTENASISKSENGKTVVANPYTGTTNADTKYGVFEWKDGTGYQPDNIGGEKLSKSGKTVSEMLGTTGNTGSTGINIDEQNVWKLKDKYYVWDGSMDQYVDITEVVSSINNKEDDEYTKNDLFGDTFKRNFTSRFPFSIFK